MMHSDNTTCPASGSATKYDLNDFRRRTSPSATTLIRTAFSFALLCALLLLAAVPSPAQTEVVLYNFTGTPDGSNPYGGLTLHNGNLFGTTSAGGQYGFGSVYELTPNGSGGWSQTVLYSFCPLFPNCTDGQTPTYSSLLFDNSGNLYGTTFQGGTTGDGVVFKLSLSGGTWTESVLYSFLGKPDAANPVNGLIMDKAGNLYGTAYAGGAFDNGAVFELSPTVSGTWTERVIASINSLYGGLVMNNSGYIFGTTSTAVFALVPSGSTWTRYTLFSFDPAQAATQGSSPNGTLAIDSANNLYGTTQAGGTNNLGVVYKLRPTSTPGKFSERILYNFGGNGTQPFAGVVLDSAGNLFGTTTAGGKNNAGVIYQLSPTSTGAYQEKVIQAFKGTNGAVPYAGVILDSQNYIYGTTFYGGANGMGTVYVANAHAALTTATVTSSLNPSKVGDGVTFTATVTSPVGPPPDGSIVVFEPIGQAPMINGVASYTTYALPAGTTKINAAYFGDLNFVWTRSAPLYQNVSP